MSDYDAALHYLHDISRERLPEPPKDRTAEERRLAKILSVLVPNRAILAKQIAKLVGRKYSPRLRAELALLCERGLIRRARGEWGYLLVGLPRR